MRVVVLGASGLLGRAIGNELLDRGHQVVAVSRSGALGDRLGAAAESVRRDLAAPDADGAALDALLDGADAVVHALGPDDRAPLALPVAETLDRLLVGVTVRVARAVRRQRVGRLIVLGSYFSTFDRLHPERRLARHHPYIAARGQQAVQAEAAAGEGVLSVLEIPFVFGAVPGVQPMWKDVFFDRLRRGPVGVTPRGGSAAVRHSDVARAAALLAEGAVPAGRYPLVVDNVTYRRFSEVVLDELGRRVRVVPLPGPVLTAGAVALSLGHRLGGHGMGLDPWRVDRDLLRRNLFLDPVAHCAPFGSVPASVEPAIRATVRAAYGLPEPVIDLRSVAAPDPVQSDRAQSDRAEPDRP